MHPDDKYPIASDIDKIISAELPNKEDDPIAFEIISQFMMHGPCGNVNPAALCMKNGTCSKHFPKKFCANTTVDESGFPIYKRRDDGSFVLKNDIKLDNRYVVPHNQELVIKYKAHINVEWCNKGRSLKYLFKYINKGPDKTTVVLQESIAKNSGNNNEGDMQFDEIKSYLDCRYLSASEACWRIYYFDIQYRCVGVKRLNFHLPEEHTVTFKDSDYLDNVLNRYDIFLTRLLPILFVSSFVICNQFRSL